MCGGVTGTQSTPTVIMDPYLPCSQVSAILAQNERAPQWGG